MKKSSSELSLLAILTGLIIIYYLKRLEWLLQIAALLGLAGILSNKIRAWIHKGWNLLSITLGAVVPRIILSLVFFLILTPLSFFSRIFRSSSPIQIQPKAHSMFLDQQKTHSLNDFEKTW